MENEINIKSVLRRQVNINMEDLDIRIERIGNHGSAYFYLWTSMEPSEGIHPTVESVPLTKHEVLTRIELLCEYRGKSLDDAEKLAIDQVFLMKVVDKNLYN